MSVDALGGFSFAIQREHEGRVVTAMAANLQSKVEYDTGVEGTRASLWFRL